MAARRKAAPTRLTPGTRRITLTIDADEVTLNRLATLLLFAKLPLKEELAIEEAERNGTDLPPLLRLDQEDTEEPELDPLTEDPELARAEITRLLSLEAEKMGLEWVRNHLREFGVERISELKDEQLPAFLADIQRTTPRLRTEAAVK